MSQEYDDNGLLQDSQDSQESQDHASNHDMSQSTTNSLDIDPEIVLKVFNEVSKAIAPLQLTIVELRAELDAKKEELEKVTQKLHVALRDEMSARFDRLEAHILKALPADGSRPGTHDLSKLMEIEDNSMMRRSSGSSRGSWSAGSGSPLYSHINFDLGPPDVMAYSEGYRSSP